MKIVLASFFAIAVPMTSAYQFSATQEKVRESQAGDSSAPSVAGLVTSVLPKVQWSKHPDDEEDDDEEHLIETTIVAHISGVDVNVLTSEEEAFIEDALGWSFNKVSGDDDYTNYHVHLVNKGTERADDEDATMLGKSSKKRGFYRSHGGFGCRYCGGGDRKALRGGVSDAALGILGNVEKWEEVFCNTLVDSGFDVFEEVDECVFDLEKKLGKSSKASA